MPRDLFNESKLLKCMGQVALLLHDGKHPRLLGSLRLTHDSASFPGFLVEQDPGDGSFSVENMWLRVDGERYRLFTSLNSKDPYPLYMDLSSVAGAEELELPVLTAEGKFSGEFVGWMQVAGIFAEGG